MIPTNTGDNVNLKKTFTDVVRVRPPIDGIAEEEDRIVDRLYGEDWPYNRA